MKSLNKALSLFLCFIIVLNMVPVVQGTGVSSEDLAIVSYTVPVISNEYTNQYVTIYAHEGKFFMSLNDIGDFTRCTLTEDDETLTLTHGLREIVINKSTGHMKDSDIVDQGNITLLEHNGMYLCEGIPMLQYLGAACSIHEEKELEVLMPSYTIWESIMPDYLDYYFDISELYGGEDNVKISLICDTIADVLDGISGHGLLGSYDIHLEDALYEVLNVDMMKYSSVQQSAAEENQKINDFLTSDIYGFILDGSEKTVDEVYEVLDYYAGFYLNTQIWKNSYLENLYFEAGNLKAASELGSKINKQVYTQSVMQADLKDVKVNKPLLSVGMLAFDVAVTSYGLMQYDDDTRNLFARTINDEMFAHTNYQQVSWKNVSDKITNTLKSTGSVLANTAATKIAEATADEITKYGVQKALSGFTAKANIYAAAAQIGLFLASLANHNSNEAFSADLNAILLNAAQFDIAMMASQLLVDERDKYHFANADSLERIKDMFTLYYRFAIAFSENVAKSFNEFGGKNGKKWADWFSSTEETSVANDVAEYLYRITNCVIVRCVDYSQLTDSVITHDWLTNMDRTISVSDAYMDAFTDDDGWQYCYHIPQFHLYNDLAQEVNQTIYNQYSDILERDVYSSMQEYGSPEVNEMTYIWGHHDGLASVLIQIPDTWVEYTEYSAFTISAATGKEATLDEILAEFGLDREGYYTLVHNRLKQYWDMQDDLRDIVDDDAFFEDRVNRTLSNENIRKSIPYINPDGGLSFIANIYSLAAGDSYPSLINAEGELYGSYPECTQDHTFDNTDSLQVFIENCDCRYFSNSNISDFDEDDLLYARNAIYAKSGWIFRNEQLADYFSKYSWYTPSITSDQFTEDMLNCYQIANRDLILAFEEGSSSTQSSASVENLIGNWYSESAKIAYIFSSTGGNVAVTGSGLQSVSGEYIEIDLRNGETDYGGFDLRTGTSITFHRPRTDTKNISMRGNTFTMDGDVYVKVPSSIKNQVLGTWYSDDRYISFGEEKYKDHTGSNTYSGSYYVLSADLIAFWQEGDYLARKYSITGTTMTYRNRTYQKNGADSSAAVLEKLAETILGTWRDDTYYEYRFHADGSYERYYNFYSMSGELISSHLQEQGLYEIRNHETIRLYRDGKKLMMEDLVYDPQDNTINTEYGNHKYSRFP